MSNEFIDAIITLQILTIPCWIVAIGFWIKNGINKLRSNTNDNI